jgi:hypothetical protein
MDGIGVNTSATQPVALLQAFASIWPLSLMPVASKIV